MAAVGGLPYPAPMPASPSPRALPSLRAALLAWYDGDHRDLPWRRTSDPWAVLVSEVMLQQTTVAAVTPYYERFMARWPTAADLARCEDDDLASEWSGLGYYRRARMLKQAALAVSERGMPVDRDGLRELPGVGDYTAAAVASIALGEPVAAVDGNVERVLCRLHALDGDPRKAAGRRVLRERAEALLDGARPGDFNQALMELGARVCRPKSPRCAECPLHAGCAARRSGEPERWPPPPKPTSWKAVTRVVIVADRRGRVLLGRRTESPNAGFLDLPGRDLLPGELDAAGDPRDGAGVLAQHLNREHGLVAEGLDPLPPHRHVITRHRILVLPFAASRLVGRPKGGVSFVDLAAASAPPTTATKRILSKSLPHVLHAPS